MSVSVLPAFRLPLIVERDEDGSFYATSPELQGFLVHGESVDVVFSLAPGVAKALIEAMREKGLEPDLLFEEQHLPFETEILVA